MSVEAIARANPFPGLRPFEDDEAYLFFGRETQVDELLRRLRSQRFIAVVGTSGSGKSSLIRAGLYSALRVGAMSGAGSRWRIATMRPGNDPIGELAAELERARLLGSDGDPELRIDLAYAILERGALGLIEIVRQMQSRSDENVLIVVDQFEELFRYAQTDVNAAAAFVNLLIAATAQVDLRLYVVLTMRSDFLGDCAGFADLPERINRGLYLVPRMTREQLEAAIVGPVKVAGAQIAPKLVNRLLNDVGDDADQLPVLAHALMLTFDLWFADHADGEPIDERHYRATGGLAQAIDAHAERIYATLTPAQQTIADKMFAAITELGSDNRGIRRPLALSEICAVCSASEADVRTIVEAYRARTCSFLRPPPDVPLTGHTVVDISHEALMRGWSRLRRLLTEEVESARAYRRLSDAAEQHAAGQGALLIDPALSLNLQWRDRIEPTAAWAERYGGDFNAAIAFLERSFDERARQRAAKRIAARRAWTLASVVISVLVLLTFASVASFWGAQRERTESLLSQSHFLARDATAAVIHGDAVTGMLLALEALPLRLDRPDRPYLPAAALALEAGLNSRLERHVLVPSGAAPLSFSSAPGGKRIAIGMSDNTVRLYDAATEAVARVLRGPTAAITSVAYSADGKRIVASSNDRTARIWDAESGRTLRTLRLRSACNNAVFSPDGRFVLTASDGGLAQIWRANDGTQLRVLRGHSDAVSDAEYSPDGSRIVTASSDKTARLWDAASGRTLRILRGHTGAVSAAVYSRDGTHIVTASNDRTAIIWDTKSGAALQTLHGHTASVNFAAFAPDGKTIVTASDDKTALVWDVATGVPLFTLAGHEGPIGFAAFSPDGMRIRTVSSDDGTLRTWDAPASPHVVVLRKSAGNFFGVAYSHDGKFVVSGSLDHRGTIWNAATGTPVLMLRGGTNDVVYPAFSPDDKRIVTLSFDGTIRVWDATNAALLFVIHAGLRSIDAAYSPDGKLIATTNGNAVRLWNAATGAPVAVLRGHTDMVRTVAFSPDGSRLVTGSRDNTARLWNVASGKTIRIFRGHVNWTAAAFSPDGKRVATGSFDGTARVWDAASGNLLFTIRPRYGRIGGVAYSPDGSEIAFGMPDGKVSLLFDSSNGAPLDILRGNTDELFFGAFSPDGRHYVSTSLGTTTRIWPIPPRRRCQELIDAARRAIPRQLSDAQRAEDYLGPRASAPLVNPFGWADECR